MTAVPDVDTAHFRLTNTFSGGGQYYRLKEPQGADDDLRITLLNINHMNKNWHYQAFAALAVVFLCLFISWLTGDQGQHTFELFGSRFGIARSKHLAFVVWRGEFLKFPFDQTLGIVMLVALGVMVAITWHHFRTRSSDV